jgi:hypothetical protein
MHDLARRSNGTLQVVRDRSELEAFIKAREADRRKVAAILGIEGNPLSTTASLPSL